MAIKGLGQRRKPHFFKPFLPDSYQQLAIPKAFLKHLAGENCVDGQEIILRNQHCKDKSWPVKLNGFCFKEGWSDFVRDHELSLGEFVVFGHEGGLVFDVIVFGHSACEKKQYPALYINIEDDNRVEEKEIKVSSVPLSGRVITRPMTRSLQREAAMISSNRQASCEDLGKQLEVKGPLSGRVITRPMTRSQQREAALTSSNRQASCEDLGKQSEVKGPLSGRVITHPMTRSQRRKTAMTISNRQASFEDRGKQFEIKRPHRRKPSIPKNFRRSNGLTRKIFKVIIRDQKGRLWPVNLCDNRSKMGSGWLEFVTANCLKEDTCIFKKKDSVKRSNRGAIVLDFTVSGSKNRGALVKKDEQIEPTNPSFEKSISLFIFKAHCLYIPKYFATSNDLMGKIYKTKITDGKGRSWRGQLKHRKSDDVVYITSDWTQIFTSNGLKAHDTCTLELTRRGKGKLMEFSLL
ncbi:B3 domain-containing protein REM17-like [Macadamia integrifolia]|uniref:B3 domain-containing protein REM17-like n=1 Tax=Macadamia integrifolia TaxID=60698 RepID=UPI001C4FFE6F|nr:B3 domain-containing protein REM17-like [Macadamia integrifolia]